MGPGSIRFFLYLFSQDLIIALLTLIPSENYEMISHYTDQAISEGPGNPFHFIFAFRAKIIFPFKNIKQFFPDLFKFFGSWHMDVNMAKLRQKN
jgi:hypothetical protein